MVNIILTVRETSLTSIHGDKIDTAKLIVFELSERDSIDPNEQVGCDLI